MAISFLHPLTQDTVGTSFDILVAYDFTTDLETNIIRVTCTSSLGTVTPPYYDVDKGTAPTGELTFNVTNATAGQDTNLVVTTTNPANNGSDSQPMVHVVDNNMLPVGIVGVGPLTPLRERKGERVKTAVMYLVAGTSYNAGQNKIKVKARSVKVGDGHPDVSRPVDATPDDNGDWHVRIPVDDDGTKYLSFEAKLGNYHNSRGRKR
jgi:hypothetical protein